MRTALIMAAFATTVISSAVFGGEIKNETFDTDGTFDDYTGPGKLFYSYVTNNTPTIGVSGGVCEMSLIANDGASVYAIVDLGETKTLVSMKMDYKAIQLSAATSAWTLFFGKFPDEVFNPSWHITTPGARNWATVRVNSTGYTVNAIDGAGTYHPLGSLSIGTTYTWSIFLNESGESVSFIGPDDTTYSLDTACWSLFVDTTQVGHNLPKGTGGSSAYLRGIVMNVGRNHAGATSRNAIDNIVIRDDLKLYTGNKTTLITIR